MKSEVPVEQLCKAAYRSCLSLARCRENVNYMVRQYVGDNYAEDGADLRLPLNLISLYHRVVLPKLVADNPRFSLSTWNDDARRSVAAMQDVGNDAIKRMRLGATLERVGSGALFNSGWCKVGRCTTADAGRFTYKLKKGSVFAANISLDDIAFDPHAHHVHEAFFIGHRFRVPLEDILDDPRYQRGLKKRRGPLTATDDKMYTETGIERTSMILRGYFGQNIELWDMVDLWEFYIPRLNMTVVVTAEDLFNQGEDEPLLEEEWIGPPGGSPYHLCGFGNVPDNLLPKAPIPDIFTLHEDTNNLLRKLIQQGKDQKKTLPVTPGSEGDVKNLRNANNGDTFECAMPERLKELNTGGPDPANFELMMKLKELTDWVAGNISSVGGLAPQAKTATQERLLNDSSNATISDMQSKMVDFAAGVGEHIMWYLWEDPFTTHDHPLQIGPNVFIPRSVSPKDRQKLDFDKIKLILEPYSLQRQTPAEVDAQLTQIMTQIVIPALPYMQQGGVNPDWQQFMQIKAELLNRPELLRVLSMMTPPEKAASTGGETPRMPGQTERTYIRESRSDRTQQGEGNERIANMHATSEGNGQ